MKRLLLLVSIFSTLAAQVSLGQWQSLKKFSTDIKTVYFMDKEGRPSVGFVGLGNGEIWRTSDNGATWTHCASPATVTPHYGITAITFADSLNGWAGLYAGYIWATTDGGITWFNQASQGQNFSVYYEKNTKLLFSTAWAHAGTVSSDMGQTWTTFVGNNYVGIAFSSDTGILTIVNGGPTAVHTSDGGKTWTNSATSFEAWAPRGLPAGAFVAASEVNSNVYYSADAGNTWTIRSSIGSPTGCVAGSSAALALQTQSSGCYVSFDTAKTWQSICGPSNYGDSRFYTKGVELFAGDASGTLWYLKDYSVPATGAISIEKNILVANVCDSTRGSIRLVTSSPCGSPQIIGANVLSGDGFTLDAGVLPRTINSRDSIQLKYDPVSGHDSARIHLRFSNSTVTDTIVTVYGIGTRAGAMAVRGPVYLFKRDPCDRADTIGFIANLACDAATILSAFLEDSSHIQLQDLHLPQGIRSRDSIAFAFVGTADSIGRYTTTLHVRYVTSTGEVHDTTVQVVLQVNSISVPEPLFTPTAGAVIRSLDPCSISDSTIRISNLSCDSLQVTAIALLDSAVFSLDNLSLPITIRSGRSITLKVHGLPRDTGVFSSTIRIRVKDSKGRFIDTTLPVRMVSQDIKPIVAQLSSTKLNLGRIPVPCSDTATALLLSNPSCFDLRIDSATWLGADSTFWFTSATFPLVIPAGGVDTLLVHFKPRSTGNATAQLRLRIWRNGRAMDTMILVRGTGIGVFSDSVLDRHLAFDTVSKCSQSVKDGYIINRTCHDIIVTATTLASGRDYSVLGPSLPDTIHAGDTLRVRVALESIDTGYISDELQVTLHDPYTGDVPESISLQGFCRSTVKWLLPDSVAFVKLLPCTAVDTFITIRNGSECDSIRLLGATSSAGIDLTDLDLPRSLGPGDSVRIHYVVRAIRANRDSAQIHVKGDMLDTAFLVRIEALPGMRLMSVKLSDSEFTASACTSVSGAVWIHNPRCDTLLLDSVVLHSADSAFECATLRNVRVAPGDSVFVTVVFDPNLGNAATAEIQVVSVQDSSFLRYHVFGKTNPAVHARLGVRSISGASPILRSAGDTLIAAIVSTDALPSSLGLKDVSFWVTFDGDVLDPIAFEPADGWTLDRADILSNGHVRCRLLSVGAPIAIGAPITYVRFRTNIADSQGTRIQLDSVHCNTDEPDYEKCTLALSPDTSLSLRETYACGDSILALFLKQKPLLSAVGITPNPIRQPQNIELSLHCEAELPAQVNIFDILGHAVSGIQVLLHQGYQVIDLPSKDLHAGSYIVRIASGSVTQSRSCLIVR